MDGKSAWILLAVWVEWGASSLRKYWFEDKHIVLLVAKCYSNKLYVYSEMHLYFQVTESEVTCTLLRHNGINNETGEKESAGKQGGGKC